MTRPTVLDAPAEVEAIVRRLPARLRPERVEGYEGRFRLVLEGDGEPELSNVGQPRRYDRAFYTLDDVPESDQAQGVEDDVR